MTIGTGKRTRAQEAYEAIRDLIVQCELRPGEMFDERRFMKSTGLGHTPVRDALQRLGHEGLVEITPRRGTFISPLNLDDVQQIFDLRVAMEAVVADAVLARSPHEVLAQIETLIERVMQAGATVSDPEVDRDFHRILLKGTGNRYLVKFYITLHDASLRLFYLTKCDMESRESQLQTLRAVRDALASGDGTGLRAVLSEHIQDFRRRVGGAISA